LVSGHLVRRHPYRFHDYPLNGFLSFDASGAIDALLTSIHPLLDREDVEDYLARLTQLPGTFSQLIDGVRYRVELGIETPGYIPRTARTKIETMLGVQVSMVRDPSRISGSRSPTYRSFEARLEEIAELTRAEKDAYLEEAERLFTEGYAVPLWEVRELLNELLEDAPAEGRATTFPDGAAFYAHALRSETTTDLTASDVHALGLLEAGRIIEEMRAQFAELGYADAADAPLGEPRSRAASAERTPYAMDTETGRAGLLAYVEALHQETLAICEPHFNLWPSQRVVFDFGPPDATVNYYSAPA